MRTPVNSYGSALVNVGEEYLIEAPRYHKGSVSPVDSVRVPIEPLVLERTVNTIG